METKDTADMTSYPDNLGCEAAKVNKLQGEHFILNVCHSSDL